ncbi:extracellular solute-binding protein [Paenibacillus cremeus]|uniref:Extracellular solute-binding protein n=1 Tax=Paenibacillus cremeus TaxID=2163881 RepID=A0A559K4C8_9BACL|nr:extracellular solute-binding protein [Paenibacillus cremeus]TVY06992.1 extracellular solute-binding protein [Paenibacillus cremeus]
MRNATCLAWLAMITLPLLTMAAGCSNEFEAALKVQAAESPARNQGQATTLILQTLQSDKSSPAYQIEQKLVNEYMQGHPNLKIEFDRLNTEQQKSKLKTQAAFGDMADITMVNPGAQMKPYVDSGVLAPLDDVVEGKLSETFLGDVLKYYSFDNKLYALPYNLNIAGIFYNKELFAQTGISVPNTFEELIDTVKQFRSQGITPIVIGAKDRWPTSFLFMNIVQRLNGGPGFLQDVLSKQRTFTDPVFEQAIAKLKELIDAGAFEKEAVSTDSWAASNLFRSGKAAMYYVGSWEVPKIEVSPVKGKVGFLKFPTVDGKGNTSDFMIAPGTAYAVSAKSKHLKESKDFLRYFSMNYPRVAFSMNAAVGLCQRIDGDLQAAGYSQLQMDLIRQQAVVRSGDMNFDNVIVPAVTKTHLDLLQNLFVQKAEAAEIAKVHQLSWEANGKR